MNEKQKRKIFCEEFLNIIKPVNPRPNQWSYAATIEYMVRSKKYMDSFTDNINQIAKEIKDRKEKNIKIFDFGTGSGVAAACLKRFCEIDKIDKQLDITATDINDSKTIRKEEKEKFFYDIPEQQTMMWKAVAPRYNIKFSHYTDVSELPSEPKTFDIIIMYAVYEHIPREEIDQTMSALKKILKDDGKLYMFTLPRTWSYLEYITEIIGKGSHDIKFGDKEIKDKVVRQGFEIEKFWRSDIFLSFPPDFTNFLYWPLLLAESIFKYTPLTYLSHNANLILHKHI